MAGRRTPDLVSPPRSEAPGLPLPTGNFCPAPGPALRTGRVRLAEPGRAPAHKGALYVLTLGKPPPPRASPLPIARSLSKPRRPLARPRSTPQVPRTGQRLRTSLPAPILPAAPTPAAGPRGCHDTPLGPALARPVPRSLGLPRPLGQFSFSHRHTLFPLGRPRRNFRSSPGNPAIALPEVAWPAVRNPEAGRASPLGAAMLPATGPLPVTRRPPAASAQGITTTCTIWTGHDASATSQAPPGGNLSGREWPYTTSAKCFTLASQ